MIETDQTTFSARIVELSGDMQFEILATLSSTIVWFVAPLSLTHSRKTRDILMVELDFPTGPPKWALPRNWTAYAMI